MLLNNLHLYVIFEYVLVFVRGFSLISLVLFLYSCQFLEYTGHQRVVKYTGHEFQNFKTV